MESRCSAVAAGLGIGRTPIKSFESWFKIPSVLRAACLIPALSLAGCSGKNGATTEDPLFDDVGGVAYEVRVEGAPSDDLEALFESTLRSFTLIERRPASMARLRRRAEADVATAEKILRSEGYYEGRAQLDVLEPSAAAAIQEREVSQPTDDGAPEEASLPQPDTLPAPP